MTSDATSSHRLYWIAVMVIAGAYAYVVGDMLLSLGAGEWPGQLLNIFLSLMTIFLPMTLILVAASAMAAAGVPPSRMTRVAAYAVAVGSPLLVWSLYNSGTL